MFRKTVSALICGTLTAAGLAAGAGAAAAASPLGHLDSVSYDQKYNTIDVAGWAGDPDVNQAAIRVHVYIDGVGAANVGTGMVRNDVGTVHPELGTHTGFYANPHQPPERGPHTVCVYAINIGPGGNVLLGCRAVVVTLPGALRGHVDGIAVDPADPSMRIARGWVLDPADAASPTPFALVRVSGPTTTGDWDSVEDVQAGLPRPDVDRAYPHNGHNHGFSVRFSTSSVDWAATDVVCIALDPWVPGWTGPVTPYCFTYAG